MGVLGVIPARYHSTRLPGKMLVDLAGRPLVLHAWRNATLASRLDRVVVAVDHPAVRAAVEAAGGVAVDTSPELPSGSDRVAAVARILDSGRTLYDVVVNIQGDEPFLPPDAIDRAVAVLDADPDVSIGTLAVPAGPEDYHLPQAVKVVRDGKGRALYFSRASIPFARAGAPVARGGTAPGRESASAGQAGEFPWPGLRHLGLYAFRRAYLERFVTLPVSALERTEGLEQLRALEDGARIGVDVGPWPAFGVDTAEDLAEARRRAVGAAARDV